MNLFLAQSTKFQRRHIGPHEQETREMLAAIGVSSIQELVKSTTSQQS